MSKPTWQFQYSVETDASRCFAWRHWTNIANWKDPRAEFELDGPFAPGSKLTTRVPGQESWHSIIREVHAETAASIEMLLPEAVLRFDWRFDELSGGGTRITQRLTLGGENAAAYAEQVAIFEKTVPEGMKKLADVLAQAEADSRHAGDFTDDRMIHRISTRLVLLVAVVSTIGCDRITKHVATTALAGVSARSYLADTVRLEYVENTGGFLGLGADWPDAVRMTVFTTGTGLVLLAMVGVAVRLRWQGWRMIGVCLVFAGGASNWVDRVAWGGVVDFMNVGIGPLRTGIFNVADVAIMVGVALLLLAGFRTGDSQRMSGRSGHAA